MLFDLPIGSAKTVATSMRDLEIGVHKKLFTLCRY